MKPPTGSSGNSRRLTPRSQLVNPATRLIVKVTLEAETRDTLGRDYHEHGGDPGRSHRNGNRTGRLRILSPAGCANSAIGWV